MKFNIIFVALIAFSTSFISCSNDDNNNVTQGTVGDVQLYFDNGVNGDALILGSTYTNSNNESLTVNRLNYIISNVVLVQADGTEYIYPKEESYFIISAEDNRLTIHLEDIPAGDYSTLKFGIGVDQQRYLQGETQQQSFWDLATQYNLTWTWSTGYRFINFEGSFTAPGLDGSKTFQVHQGSNSATDNYREVALTLPTTARVRQGDEPSIHLKTDANVLLDGQTKVKLADNLNEAQTGAAVMGGENLIHIADNSTAMFTIDHVHNGNGAHEEE
ncbi:MbnP family protein [Flavobacterium rhizosphaerae]|uniref:MbnP family protein n=1 Tax=Flavobacterium rhizosphaerae TaxID=3163298 RepID=A0ABW8YWY7_9FLAO